MNINQPWRMRSAPLQSDSVLQSDKPTTPADTRRGVDPMMAAAEDAVPTYKQHWVNLLSTHLLVKELTVTEYIPSNYDALTRCGYNVRPMSQTMGEH